MLRRRDGDHATLQQLALRNAPIDVDITGQHDNGNVETVVVEGSELLTSGCLSQVKCDIGMGLPKSRYQGKQDVSRGARCKPDSERTYKPLVRALGQINGALRLFHCPARLFAQNFSGCG
ncbi:MULTISPECIES: hypothetical protein [Burkholderia]|uniref:hypothetical protein n=1 Tax=Burkholderia sp. Ac-20392 TaxID=2703905 RepID=UPI001453D2E6|nr:MULTISPECIES: hypothetical protein [Burkholderia]MBN3768430.1 hypothetical protein [Burkholderia sp. Se-20378]MBN3796130.1 hypothetical protein [Burkholderia sp. Ac-20392]VWB69658.1 hypothetical protein BLA6860_03264 [Burkholderia lata]